jgi:hypothetical protein
VEGGFLPLTTPVMSTGGTAGLLRDDESSPGHESSLDRSSRTLPSFTSAVQHGGRWAHFVESWLFTNQIRTNPFGRLPSHRRFVFIIRRGIGAALLLKERVVEEKWRWGFTIGISERNVR